MMKSSTIVQKIIGIVFTILGIVFVSVGVVIFVSEQNFIDNAYATQGTVINDPYAIEGDIHMDELYLDGSTTIYYTVEDEAYISTIDMRSSSWNDGDEVDIYVSNDNPFEIQPGGLLAHMMSFVFGIIGLPFLLTGIGFLIYCIVKRNQKEQLLGFGKVVWATVIGSRTNYAIRMNQRHPIRFECEYIDPFTNERTIYVSDNIWDTGYNYSGQQVAVYINEDRPNQYYVDLESAQDATNDNWY